MRKCVALLAASRAVVVSGCALWLFAVCSKAQPSAAQPTREIAIDEVADLATAEPAATDLLPGLEAFVDGIVASFTQQRIAGVQVAIVKDGRVALKKGYGVAALEPERPVDPERSLFRIGSITKTFTWLALMQLEARERLRLEDPVNEHLPPDLEIPSEGWNKSIRILDLMNHTAGFEESVQGVDTSDEARLSSLRQDLARYRPARVREPGQTSVYSNYGAQLAGAIIAHESGVDYETYIEQHVLRPLELEHTTFREPYGPTAPPGLPAPMPANLVLDRAAGIEWENGAWKAFPHHHILQAASAGAGSSTAADMARYMIALLDPKALERAGVLKESAYLRMKGESFKPAPGVRGIHHGFFDAPPGARSALGYANLSHSGFVDHFASHMLVFPELGLGTFVATNSSSGGKLTSVLHELVLRQYFAPRSQPSAAVPSREDLTQFTGKYRPMRRNYTKLESIFSLDSIFELEATDGGYLLVRNRPDDLSRYAQIGRDLFQKVGGDARIAFVRNPNGSVIRVVGAMTADRVKLFGTPAWVRGWLVAGLVVSVAVIWFAWRRRRLGLTATTTRSERWMYLTASLWVALYVAGATWQLRYGFGDALQDYPQPVLKLALLLLMAAAGSTAIAVILLPFAWRKNGWSIGRKLRHTLALCVFVVLTTALHQWNAFGFHYY